MNDKSDFDVDQFIADMIAADRGPQEPEPTPEEYSRFHREQMRREEDFNRGLGITSHYDPRWI